MTVWSAHPYHYTRHLYLHSPEIVFAAALDYTNSNTYGKYGSTSIQYLLYYDAVSAGAIGNVAEGMTLLLGSTAGADDLGRCRVKGTTTEGYTGGSETVIMVWASPNIHDGEIYPQSTAYITVLDDFRPWWKAPYYASDSTAYFDGDRGVAGASYNQYPVANMGPDAVAIVDESTGLATVEFSGADSFAVAQNAVLGQLSSDLDSTYSTVIASSTYPGSTVTYAYDDNTATYWEANTNGTAAIRIDFANPTMVRRLTITASGTTALLSFELKVVVDDEFYDVITRASETGWGTNEQRTYDPDLEFGAHTRYYIWLNSCNGGTRHRIEEFELIGEDRTSTSPYTWDEDDGTITVGSATTEDTTVVFPPGHRYASLAVEDTNGATYTQTTRRHVVAVTRDTENHELDYSGAAFDAQSEYVDSGPEYLFDNDPATAYLAAIGTTTGWVECDFTTYTCVTRYQVQAPPDYETAAPNSWTFQSWNGVSFDDVDTVAGETSWAAGEIRTFTLDTPAVATKYRLNVTANDGHADYLYFAEWNLIVHSDNDGVVSNFEVVNQRLTRKGQEFTVRVYEDIDIADYPDGTWVCYWEDEVIGGAAGSLSSAGYSDREHIKFAGWILEEPTRIEATEAGTRSYVELVCGDIGAWLDKMPMKPFLVEREDSSTPAYIRQMTGANMDRFIWLLLRHFSTATEIADFIWDGIYDFWAFSALSCDTGTLWGVAFDRAQAIAGYLACNKNSQLVFRQDDQLLDSADRDSTVLLAVGEDDWTAINYTHTRHPRFHWLWSSAVWRTTDDADAIGTINTCFCVAPGETPGQGASEQTHGEQLIWGDTLIAAKAHLARREGHRYALRLNAPQGYFQVDLAHAADAGLDPAAKGWITLNISADNAAQRGLSFTDERFKLIEVNIRHNHQARTKDVSLVLEREVEGKPAAEYTP